MNNGNTQQEKDSELDDIRLERILDSIRKPAFDNTGIKNLVREKMIEKRRSAFRRRMYVTVFSAAAVVALILGTAFLLNTSSKLNLREATAEMLEENGYQELNVPRGERAELILSDGTKLIANYNSKVVYPEEFKGKERRIYVNGEVYIEVAKDASRPFIVESEGFDIRVLGTVFNIDNISETSANIVLIEGSINLTTSKDQSVTLKPNDLVELQAGEIESLRQVDPSDYTSWIKGFLSLRGESISSLATKLSEFYGVKVSCDTKLSTTKVYGKIDLRDSIEDVLTSLKEIVPMKIEQKGTSITLSGI